MLLDLSELLKWLVPDLVHTELTIPSVVAWSFWHFEVTVIPVAASIVWGRCAASSEIWGWTTSAETALVTSWRWSPEAWWRSLTEPSWIMIVLVIATSHSPWVSSPHHVPRWEPTIIPIIEFRRESSLIVLMTVLPFLRSRVSWLLVFPSAIFLSWWIFWVLPFWLLFFHFPGFPHFFHRVWNFFFYYFFSVSLLWGPFQAPQI